MQFPRFVVDFEPTELDLSDEMKKDLGKVDSVEAIDMFKNKYGTRILALHATEGTRRARSRKPNRPSRPLLCHQSATRGPAPFK